MKTKILSGATYDALKLKADNYDSVVSALVAKNEGTTAEDITLETIQEVINAEENAGDEILQAAVTELEGTVETLNSTVTTLTTERDALQTKVEALSELPGAQSITSVKPEAESSAVETNDLLVFATEHKGDTMAIAEKMREAGYGK